MNKKFIVISIFCLLFSFFSCSKKTPEDVVKQYYKYVIKKEYRKALKLIDFGGPVEDEKFQKMIEDMEKDYSGDNSIERFEIISSESSIVKIDEKEVEKVEIKTRFFTKKSPKGEETDFSLYKNDNGEWKIYINFGTK